MIISNTSPIIHLAKIGKLELLKKIFKTVLIPSSVFNEILKYPKSNEAISISKAVKEKWIKIKEITINQLLKEFDNVAKTELDVISLALNERKIILIDDQAAVKIADLFDLEVHGTLYVIIKSVKLRLLNKREAIELVNKMINNELYLSSDVYALFLERLKDLK